MTAGEPTIESGTPSPSRIRKTMLVVLTVCGFLALLPMFAFLATWIFDIDSPAGLAVLQAGMGYFLLPAYGIFALAVVAKQKALAVTAAVVVIAHVFCYSPEWQLATRLPDLAGKQQITLYSHNIKFDNETPLAETTAIQNADADLVFLQELTEDTHLALQRDGAFERYPYSSIDPRTGARGLGIFSKFPIVDVQRIVSPGFPQQRAVIDVGTRRVVLWNVHTQSPVAGPVENWRGDLDQLNTRLHEETGDVIAAGDFNATWSHRPFRDIIRGDVREAANDRGRGHARTWPMDSPNGARTRGFIRIDHVLTMHDIRPTHIEERTPNGSDHRATFTRLVLL